VKPVRKTRIASVRRDTQPSDYFSLGTGPNRSMGRLLGGEKGKFLFAVLQWSVAPVECCQFVVRRSP